MVALDPTEKKILDDHLKPFDWFHRYAVAGAKEHGLPTNYEKKKRLKAVRLRAGARS